MQKERDRNRDIETQRQRQRVTKRVLQRDRKQPDRETERQRNWETEKQRGKRGDFWLWKLPLTSISLTYDGLINGINLFKVVAAVSYEARMGFHIFEEKRWSFRKRVFFQIIFKWRFFKTKCSK